MAYKFGIKACTLSDWSRKTHPRCKFVPGDVVRVCCTSGESKRKHKYVGRKGVVVMVSSTGDGLIRGLSKYGYPRCFTRYYVLFDDGYCAGFHSHYLRTLSDAEKSERYG